MPRRPRSSQLETRTARLKLAVRRKPYFLTVAPGVGLGYRRCLGAGRWIVRAADGSGGNWTRGFGLADDHEDSDGANVLTFWEAQDRARRLARNDGEGTGDRPATVAEALDAYEADLRLRGGDVANNVGRVRLHLSSGLAQRPISLLGARELRHWRGSLMNKGLQPASVNRISRAFKAALSLATKDDPRINPAAWRSGLSGLPDAERVRNTVLPDGVIRRIVTEAYSFSRDFGLLTEVLATCGCRTGQAFALKVDDLIEDAAGPRLLMPSSRKGRNRRIERKPLPIPPSLALALRRAAAGRPGDAALLLPTAPQPHRIFPRLVARLGLDPKTTLYALRHSSIVRQLQAGVPARICASHHDTGILVLERNYSRYIAAHSDDIVRRALLEMDAPSAGVIVPMKG
jgi:integrase